jgi:hypothetical protein
MVIAKHETAIWEEVENLDETNRGEGGLEVLAFQCNLKTKKLQSNDLKK